MGLHMTQMQHLGLRLLVFEMLTKVLSAQHCVLTGLSVAMSLFLQPIGEISCLSPSLSMDLSLCQIDVKCAYIKDASSMFEILNETCKHKSIGKSLMTYFKLL